MPVSPYSWNCLSEHEKEIAQELSQKLTNQWLTKYKDIMKVCNYTVGQADSDNTWASMQDNGSHIISFNISLVDPGDRDITLEAVCNEMREDLKAYPEFSKAQVILGGSNTGDVCSGQCRFLRCMDMI